MIYRWAKSRYTIIYILYTTRILQWKPIGTRNKERPRKRWIAGIEEDLQIMGVRRWRKQCEKSAEWKKITEKAKTHRAVTPVKEEEDILYTVYLLLAHLV
jgi:hypothetical protein